MCIRDRITALDDGDASDLPQEQLVFFDLDRDVIAARFIHLNGVSEMTHIAEPMPVEFELEIRHV